VRVKCRWTHPVITSHHIIHPKTQQDELEAISLSLTRHHHHHNHHN
jgi:hypothetical protein